MPSTVDPLDDGPSANASTVACRVRVTRPLIVRPRTREMSTPVVSLSPTVTICRIGLGQTDRSVDEVTTKELGPGRWLHEDLIVASPEPADPVGAVNALFVPAPPASPFAEMSTPPMGWPSGSWTVPEIPVAGLAKSRMSMPVTSAPLTVTRAAAEKSVVESGTP